MSFGVFIGRDRVLGTTRDTALEALEFAAELNRLCELEVATVRELPLRAVPSAAAIRSSIERGDPTPGRAA